MGLITPTTWWVLAGLLVAAELATGTFYLLMLALGCAAGAVAAHMGLGASAQLAAAAVVGVAATVLWHLRRASQPLPPDAQANPDVNLDVGQFVQVQDWSPQGQTQVSHRGTTWAASLAEGEQAAPGTHVVVALRGNRLILKPAP